jgi:hypothetical protein
MPRPLLEVATIFRAHGPAYRARHRLPRHQLRVMRAIELCRSAALGGHVERCGHCAFSRISYNSCRNRHCPKCQSLARARWLAGRQADLLPVEYFHVVFTMPTPAADIAFDNQRLVYGILFQAASQTLMRIGADPRHLGARLGLLAILHTWGQNLLFHPHLHCVVPGGGLSSGGERWIACRPGFLFPVRVLSRLFRGLFCAALAEAHRDGHLRFAPARSAWEDPAVFAKVLTGLQRQEWVVYAKAPFGGPRQVLDYLGRYTHRVAIANERLLSVGDDHVRFRWKDYRRGNRVRTMQLAPQEFLRRFLLHTLPPGFQRIRHFGFLANATRRQLLPRIRRILNAPTLDLLPLPPSSAELLEQLTAQPAHRCPQCHTGTLLRVETLLPYRYPLRPPDTS